MKILFYGSVLGNSGPCNVNKGMVRNLTSTFWYAKSKNKYMNMAEAIMKCLFSDAVVISGISKQGMILMGFAKLIRKKAVLIMHGCAAYEVVVNNQKGCEAGLHQEEYLMKNADLLLPVSKKFRDWVCGRYPQYADKTKYLYNGIDAGILKIAKCGEPIRGSVAAAGADRGVKNNIIVARAVEEMCGNANLTVYGAIYHGVPTEFAYTRYTGVIPHADYIHKLQETELFVVNSIFETFSISVIEALCCGCSILVSEIVGVTDLLALEETDIIHDPMNVQEVREKIEYLMKHPNNKRIMSKLDLNAYSYQKSVERLESLCKDLIKG